MFGALNCEINQSQHFKRRKNNTDGNVESCGTNRARTPGWKNVPHTARSEITALGRYRPGWDVGFIRWMLKSSRAALSEKNWVITAPEKVHRITTLLSHRAQSVSWPIYHHEEQLSRKKFFHLEFWEDNNPPCGPQDSAISVNTKPRRLSWHELIWLKQKYFYDL